MGRREKLAGSMEEQLKRGYLKLAILYTLLKGPSHGYQIMKRIREATFNLLTPTVGSIYPTLEELESKGLIKGRWHLGKRRVKIYEITSQGKETFKDIIEKHFNMASTIRRMVLNRLSPLINLEESDEMPIMMQAVKIILLNENATKKEKIEALKNLRDRIQNLNGTLKKLIENINRKIKELESSEK
ncbi:MAG: PadR family transcriptional regulator [Candidatus Bathyarchaeia archaeon]